MKIRFTLLPLMLLTLASAGESSKSSDLPLRQFYTEEAIILDEPYYGTIAPVFDSCGPARRAMPLVLNYLLPPEGDKGYSAKGYSAKGYSTSGVPHLATTKDGQEYWDRHALRSELPTQEELAALRTFEEFVAVLGPPTDPPSEGRVEGQWGYDVVVWRLFTPIDETNIAVLHVTLHRKWNTTHATPVYLIECYGIRGGGLEAGGEPLFPLPGQPGPVMPIIETPVVSPS